MRLGFLFLLCFGLSINALFAQVPQAFNYQAVIRDASGQILPNSEIPIIIQIKSKATGSDSLLYSELIQAQTSAYGVVNMAVGRNDVIFGAFDSINWFLTPIFIETLVDIDQTGSFVSIGETEVLSVPYSLTSPNSAGSADSPWKENGNDVYVTNSFVGIGTDSPTKPLFIEMTSSGTNNRVLLQLNNKSDDSGSATRMDLTAGNGSNMSFLGLSTFAKSYTASPGYGGYSAVFAAKESDGLILRSDNTNGRIRFNIGGSSLVNEKAHFNVEGRLTLMKSDVYLENIGSGVIMKSPDGNCWRVTPDNSGNLISTSINCP